jgi:pimeloyl-ACP methyl ester carboxylesterase
VSDEGVRESYGAMITACGGQRRPAPRRLVRPAAGARRRRGAARGLARRAVGALALAALLLVAAGCGSGSSPGTSTATSAAAPSTTLAAAPPQPSERCGDPAAKARTFWLDAPGGARLQAATVGGGPDAAVFVHESGSEGMCGFWSYANWLARTHHLRAVLFDQCGYGESACPGGRDETGPAWGAATAAAVAWARDHGARHVTLVGASFGGIVVLHAATSIRPAVDAVVDLSGELSWNDLDSLPASRGLAVPALFAVAPGDRYVTVGDMRRVYQASSARPKRLVVLSQPLGHGWAMLSDNGWTPLASTVADWVGGRRR